MLFAHIYTCSEKRAVGARIGRHNTATLGCQMTNINITERHTSLYSDNETPVLGIKTPVTQNVFHPYPAPPISMLKLLGPGCTLVRENGGLFLPQHMSRRCQH